MKLAPFRVLSDDELKQIHEASLHILEYTGLRITNRRILSVLKDRGLPVDTDAGIVRFPPACVEDALSLIPRTFDVFSRQGDPAFTLGDRQPKIAAGHNAIFWVDSDTGETRSSTVADVEQFTRICDVLPAIHMVGIPVMPQDVPNPAASLLYGVRAVIENTTKPIYFSTDSARVNAAIIDMLAAAFEGDLRTQAYGISQLSPTSPLIWESTVLDALLDTVERQIPLAILPEPISGSSSPYTLAGLITIDNVECLSGLVLAQLIHPGAKVLYGNSWTTFDMRSGSALVGSVETSLCRIAGTQLAHFYDIPCHTTAPNSDNHAHDEQNAWEKTFSTFCAVGAGTDLIVNCGMFATGMTCSHEQLLMDEEISAMALRLAKGIQVSEETIAGDLIAEIGRGGSGYLTADHTLDWLRSGEYYTPRLAVRGPFASWQSAGANDAYALAKERVTHFPDCPTSPISEDVQTKLDRIMRNFSEGKVSA